MDETKYQSVAQHDMSLALHKPTAGLSHGLASTAPRSKGCLSPSSVPGLTYRKSLRWDLVILSSSLASYYSLCSIHLFGTHSLSVIPKKTQPTPMLVSLQPIWIMTLKFLLFDLLSDDCLNATLDSQPNSAPTVDMNVKLSFCQWKEKWALSSHLRNENTHTSYCFIRTNHYRKPLLCVSVTRTCFLYSSCNELQVETCDTSGFTEDCSVFPNCFIGVIFQDFTYDSL